MNDTRIPNLEYECTSTDKSNVDRQRKRQKDQHPWRRNKPGTAAVAAAADDDDGNDDDHDINPGPLFVVQ